jgi:hypothetical protein
MATDFHVNGCAEIKVGTGSASALELLGHTVDGVEIDPIVLHRPIYTDSGGGPDGVPATKARVGEIHIIRASVIVYDKAVMVKVRQGVEGLEASKAEGIMTKSGLILDASAIGAAGNGGFYRLLILSPDDSEPRNYLYATLRRKPRRVSTKETVYQLEWEAIPFIGTAATMNDVVLFNTTTS